MTCITPLINYLTLGGNQCENVLFLLEKNPLPLCKGRWRPSQQPKGLPGRVLTPPPTTPEGGLSADIHSGLAKVLACVSSFFSPSDSPATAVMNRNVTYPAGGCTQGDLLRTLCQPHSIPQCGPRSLPGSPGNTATPLTLSALPLAPPVTVVLLEVSSGRCQLYSLFIIPQKPRAETFRREGVLSWAANTVDIEFAAFLRRL